MNQRHFYTYLGKDGKEVKALRHERIGAGEQVVSLPANAFFSTVNQGDVFEEVFDDDGNASYRSESDAPKKTAKKSKKKTK